MGWCVSMCVFVSYIWQIACLSVYTVAWNEDGTENKTSVTSDKRNNRCVTEFKISIRQLSFAKYSSGATISFSSVSVAGGLNTSMQRPVIRCFSRQVSDLVKCFWFCQCVTLTRLQLCHLHVVLYRFFTATHAFVVMVLFIKLLYIFYMRLWSCFFTRRVNYKTDKTEIALFQGKLRRRGDC